MIVILTFLFSNLYNIMFKFLLKLWENILCEIIYHLFKVEWDYLYISIVLKLKGTICIFFLSMILNFKGIICYQSKFKKQRKSVFSPREYHTPPCALTKLQWPYCHSPFLSCWQWRENNSPATAYRRISPECPRTSSTTSCLRWRYITFSLSRSLFFL